jgi:hypothetical protein
MQWLHCHPSGGGAFAAAAAAASGDVVAAAALQRCISTGSPISSQHLHLLRTASLPPQAEELALGGAQLRWRAGTPITPCASPHEQQPPTPAAGVSPAAGQPPRQGAPAPAAGRLPTRWVLRGASPPAQAAQPPAACAAASAPAAALPAPINTPSAVAARLQRLGLRWGAAGALREGEGAGLGCTVGQHVLCFLTSFAQCDRTACAC